ncbi:MAG: MFS transporter [Candidatus Levybacteria bacterium]|nr:MFS transporter [Candidatus Levybacteria bacterium]
MKNRIFRAFEERSFLFLWLAEITTQIAFNLFNFFVILQVFSLTKSSTAVSFAVICFTLPSILFGVLAGVYVDRWDKKQVLFTSNIIRGIVLIVLAIFHSNLIFVYLALFIVALVTQFFIPAETPMIPLIVRKDFLFSANALFGLGLFGSVLFAYLLSGPVILLFGEVNTLLLLGGLFLVSSFFVSGIKINKGSFISRKGILGTPKSALMTEVKHSLSIMRNSKEIYNSIFLLTISQILLLVLAVVAPGYANQVLKISIQKFPLFFIAPAAIGLLVGAIFLLTILHYKSKEKLATLGLFLSGIAMLLLPYGSAIAGKGIVKELNTFLPHSFGITNLHLVVVLAFVLGLANAFVFVPSNTILQEKTSDEFRGKIYGVLNSMVGMFSLIPILAAGGLSDFFGVEKVIVGIGIVLLGLGISRILIDY